MTESFLILKYGDMNKAFHLWMNSADCITYEESEFMQEFYLAMTFRKRCELTRERQRNNVRRI